MDHLAELTVIVYPDFISKTASEEVITKQSPILILYGAVLYCH